MSDDATWEERGALELMADLERLESELSPVGRTTRPTDAERMVRDELRMELRRLIARIAAEGARPSAGALADMLDDALVRARRLEAEFGVDDAEHADLRAVSEALGDASRVLHELAEEETAVEQL